MPSGDISKLLSISRQYTPWATLGRASFGEYTLWSMERPWLNNKPFISCIPEGVYSCHRYSSAKYKNTFEVLDVENRTSILFHKGNSAEDVQGCIVFGKSRAIIDNTIKVLDSRTAFNQFMMFMEDEQEFQLSISAYVPGYSE